MKRSFVRTLVCPAAVGVWAALALPAWVCGQSSDPFQEAAPAAPHDPSAGEARAENPRSTPKEPERVVKTLEQWRRQLTHEQFLVTRLKATEAPFSGKYAHGHWNGTFLCVCCGAPLFDAKHKFDSGTGWPSFDRPVGNKALETAWDYSEQEPRVEVTCRRCGAHLGHVFQDGPTSTGLRFCINSLAIKLDSEKETPAARTKQGARHQTATARPSRKSVSPRTSAPPAEDKAAREDPPAP